MRRDGDQRLRRLRVRRRGRRALAVRLVHVVRLVRRGDQGALAARRRARRCCRSCSTRSCARCTRSRRSSPKRSGSRCRTTARRSSPRRGPTWPKSRRSREDADDVSRGDREGRAAAQRARRVGDRAQGVDAGRDPGVAGRRDGRRRSDRDAGARARSRPTTAATAVRVRERIGGIRAVADTAKLRERYTREIARLESEVARSEKKLANESFVARASAEVVGAERAKLDEYRRELRRNRDALAALGGMTASPDLLLLSSSRVHGYGYLEFVRDELVKFLAGCPTLHFVPFALHDHDGYTQIVRAAFAPLGIERASGVHEARRPGWPPCARRAARVRRRRQHLSRCCARCRRARPAGDPARAGRRGRAGATSGCERGHTTITAPTIRTTNDMPIVAARTAWSALGLVPFPAQRALTSTRERLRPTMGESTGPANQGVPRGERGPGARPARGRLAAPPRRRAQAGRGGRRGALPARPARRQALPAGHST